MKRLVKKRMFKLIRKLVSLALVLMIVALVLNLNIQNKPARDYAMQFWQNPYVQQAYRAVSSRIMAVINKDINVEDVFKPELNQDSAKNKEQASPTKLNTQDALDAKDLQKSPSEAKVAKKSGPMLEVIKAEDKQKLKNIIKSSNNKDKAK